MQPNCQNCFQNYLHFFLCNQYCCVNAKYLFAIPIATMASNRDGKTVQQWVDDCITSQPVVVFSKTYCPFCDMAKVRIWKYLFKKIWLTKIDSLKCYKIIFSKLIYFRLTKDALSQAGIADYLLIELENREDCGEVQNYLQNITGGRTVSINLFSIYKYPKNN